MTRTTNHVDRSEPHPHLLRPTDEPTRVLLVEDDDNLAVLCREGLEACGYAVNTTRDAESALSLLDRGGADVVITDLNLPHMNGLELCERIAARGRRTPVLVITAHASVETAIGALRRGAHDFLTKPFQLEELVARVGRAAMLAALQDEVVRLSEASTTTGGFGKLLGTSPAMTAVGDLLGRVADSPTTVLIGGESGTGKEVVARALHAHSRRKAGPFVAVNCSALPSELLESELFGHARGAFSGANTTRKGLFSKADGGTLFLDEIGEMPLELQPKLLRALEERTIRPVGSDQEHRFDARLVCATNADLEIAVAEGRFREDLFFRINVIRVALPPLRARGNDILVLAQHFLSQVAREHQKAVTSMSPEVASKLLAYNWPGNVRELRNCIERGVAVARLERLVVDDLPEAIQSYTPSSQITMTGQNRLCSMDTVEAQHIGHVMRSVGNNKTRAAKILGFTRKKLYRKLRLHGLDAQETDSPRPSPPNKDRS